MCLAMDGGVYGRPDEEVRMSYAVVPIKTEQLHLAVAL